MRINIQNMLRQAGQAIPSDRDTGAYSFVLQQLAGHLLQLRDRTQAGDLMALDEFFKLYVFNDGNEYTRSPPVCVVCGGKGRIDTIRIGNTVNIPCPECSAKETPLEHDPGQERVWRWRQACSCRRCSDETKRLIATQNRRTEQ